PIHDRPGSRFYDFRFRRNNDMKWLITTIFVAVLMVAPAWANIVWGPATFGDDNGGGFINDATYVTSGATATFTFPSFFTNGQFGFPPNYLSLAISASGDLFTGVWF